MQLVRARRLHPQRPLDQVDALVDGVPVPRRAVLVGQEDEVAGGVRAGGAAGVGQHEHGQQAQHLRLVGHQVGQEAGQPHRFGAALGADVVGAGRHVVAFGEQQLDRRQHGREPLGQLVGSRHSIGDVGVGEAALRSHEALLHGRLGREEQPGDLDRREAAERPQRRARHADSIGSTGWQHVKISRSTSSRTTSSDGTSHPSRAARLRWAASCLPARLASRRSRS